jgi:ammonia channel protein AmtB
VTILLTLIGTTSAALITKALVGLRASEEVEIAALDISEHGEEGCVG